MIHNRLFSLIYRSACFIFAAIGILAILGVFKNDFHAKTLMYYTLLSNILVLGLFGYLAVRTAIGLKKQGQIGSSDYAAELEMVCSVDIFLTFLVYWVLLAPQSFAMDNPLGLFSFENLAVHAITPVLCILDYVFFTDAHKLKIRDIFLPLIFPIAYLVTMSIAGASGFVFQMGTDGLPVHYPYFFFDYDRTGAMSAVYILGLVALFILLSVGLYFLDKKWNKKVLLPKVKKAVNQ